MNRGFSILELLTVCVIIALLVSMLLSAVAKARKQAQKVACRVVTRSYAMEFSEKQGKLLITIPQEANCHECHKPRYNAGLYLDTIDSRRP
jgi:prepilin-type N-terminal cleavage/methylation domain-containing protein